MNTQTIIAEVRRGFEIKNEIFENYFADAIESANNYAIDSTSEAFQLGEYDGIEFWEDGVTNIEDETLRKKVNVYYFSAFEKSLRTKAKGIIEELSLS